MIAHVISHVFKVHTKRKQKHKFLSDVQDYILMEISGTLSSIGGYDCSFINTPHDRFVCKICHLPSRDPYLSVCCGHVFCKSCLDNAKRIVSITYACPICREEKFVTFPNKQAAREIKSLHIYCTNKDKGCEWHGELNDINNHLGNSYGCQFEEVKCSNECGKMIQRRYLTSHVETKCPRRKVNCQYCHDTGEHQFIEGQHKKKCPKLPLPCPNKCKVGKVPRKDMEAHRRVCQLEIVKCLNKCGRRLERHCLFTHIERECPNRTVECQHCHTIAPHNQITGKKHRKLCPTLPLPCPNKCEIGSVPREEMEAHRKVCPLEMIQCEYYSVGCEVRMARKDQQKHENEKVKEHLMKTKYVLTDIKHELSDTKNTLGNTKCELNNTNHELTDAKRELANAKSELTDAKGQLTSALQRINTLEVLLYLAIDKAVVKPTSSAVVLELSVGWSNKLVAMAMMSKSGDQECPVILQMSTFNRLKENDVTWYSTPIYTHNKGYKMCLNIDAAGYGDGEGSYLSVYLLLMKGPHDDELTWPLRGKFEIKMLNQISDDQHHSITVTYDDKTPKDSTSRVKEGNIATHGWGRSQFIAIKDLLIAPPKYQFLKDDCLFFQVAKL